MKLSLTLDYTLGEGFLAAYLNGLRAGVAVAGRCDTCARVALPPERGCTCGVPVTVMRQLSGKATVLWRTTGTDGDLALVRFDGCDSLSIAKLDGFGAETRGHILAHPDAALVLQPEGAG